MANSIISYNGATTYFNNDNLSSPFLVCRKNVAIYLNSNISRMFVGCSNLVLNIDDLYWKYDLVENMVQTFDNCSNLTGSPVCGPNVKNMDNAYVNCRNLTGSPVCGDKVKDMGSVYNRCFNLTGSPVCGPNVVYMRFAYMYCLKLTGSPVCGPNVVDMRYAYSLCRNLTGSPVCGPNVVDMSAAYQQCFNLTGSPVCGDKVTDMAYAYINCQNLTGSPVCGPNVENIAYAYANCYNLYGNMNISNFWRSNSTGFNAVKCVFKGRNTSNRLNIFVPYGSNKIFEILRNANVVPNSITNTNFDWTLDLTNDRFYSTDVNIYVYGGNASI